MSLFTFFFNRSTKLLLMELLIGYLLCCIPVLYTQELTEQTLWYGLILASCFMIPTEMYRQFVLDKKNKNLK